MDMLKVLNELNACHGPAGDEGEVSAAIEKLARPYADEITRDTLGNLIVRKKGSGPRLMFSAHMDSIGLVAVHYEKDGFVRVAALGGIHPSEILGTRVRFKNGAFGVVAASDPAEKGNLTVNDLYVDIGAQDEDEAKGLVAIGDSAVFAVPAWEMGTRLASPYLDDRIACVAQLMALEQLAKCDNDVYFVFSTQEEVGLRGAQTAAYAIDPDYGVAIDVTMVGDLPGMKAKGTSKLGGGAAIKVMDRSVICHPQMVAHMRALAAEKDISVQTDIISAGGTDAGAIHTTRAGVYTGGISIPCRYIHSPAEVAERGDVEACVKLMCAVAESKLDFGVK